MISESQKWYALAFVVIIGYLLYLLSPILTPFMISALLAYLADPIADKLEARKLSRTLAVVIVFFLMFLLLLIILLIFIPLLQDQLSRLVNRLPEIINDLQAGLIPWLYQNLKIDLSNIDLESIRQSMGGHWQTLGNVAGKVITQLSSSGQLLLLWISNLVLIPVVTFYLLRDWDTIVARCAELIPRKYIANTTHVVKECDAVLAEFFRGQLMVMVALGTIYTIGLWLVGIEFSLLIGMIAGLVSFVPYLGFIVGFIIAAIAAFMQFQDLIHIFYVLLVFGFGQALEGMVLSPLLVGDRIGLHPVAVIFSVMAGAQLFGFFGMLLALPVAAVITVMLRYLHEQYVNSGFYTP